jgi:hypothetical protein
MMSQALIPFSLFGAREWFPFKDCFTFTRQELAVWTLRVPKLREATQ